MNEFDENSDEYKIALINDLIFFIDHEVKFDGKLVDKLIDEYEKTGELTFKQWRALKNIHEAWDVAGYRRKKMRTGLVNLDLL